MRAAGSDTIGTPCRVAPPFPERALHRILSPRVGRRAHPEALLLVGLKHVGEAEPLAAHVTRVGLLACVSPTVPLHVGAAGEVCFER